MKRTLFVLSLLLFVTGFATLNAQGTANPGSASPAVSGMPVLTAYKTNLKAALEQGNLPMAQAHRTKLVSFMEHEIQATEAANTVVAAVGHKPSKSAANKAKAAATDLARQKSILAEFKGLNLDNATGLEAAKSKLPLVDEFDTIMKRRATSAAH